MSIYTCDVPGATVGRVERKVEVRGDTAWTLTLYAVRYAVERNTAAPWEVQTAVYAIADALQPWELQQIAREVRAKLERSRTMPKDIREDWETFAGRLEEAAKR